MQPIFMCYAAFISLFKNSKNHKMINLIKGLIFNFIVLSIWYYTDIKESFQIILMSTILYNQWKQNSKD